MYDTIIIYKCYINGRREDRGIYGGVVQGGKKPALISITLMLYISMPRKIMKYLSKYSS